MPKSNQKYRTIEFAHCMPHARDADVLLIEPARDRTDSDPFFCCRVPSCSLPGARTKNEQTNKRRTNDFTVRTDAARLLKYLYFYPPSSACIVASPSRNFSVHVCFLRFQKCSRGGMMAGETSPILYTVIYIRCTIMCFIVELIRSCLPRVSCSPVARPFGQVVH